MLVLSTYKCVFNIALPNFANRKLHLFASKNVLKYFGRKMENPISPQPYLNGISDITTGEIKRYAHDHAPPRPVVICGPSGSGKSTLLKYLMNEFPEYFGFSISHTTRKPRPGEKPGKDYYFVSRSDFEEAIKNHEFLEYAEFSGNIYGTSKKAVKNVQNQGRICILDIEIEGVKNIKKTDLKPRFIFIKPPTVQTLEERLRGRGTETEESIQKRLSKAKEELAYGETPGNFDAVLVNDDAEDTYKQLRNYLLQDVEDLKKRRKI